MKRDEIYRVVEAKYEDYADRVVMQIKALSKDCRQSGDDSGLEDVWEEFKYQVQTQESVLFEAYEETISAICHKLVESLPRHEQDLLWLVSEGYWKANDEDGLPPRDDIVENIVTELYGRVNNRACDEDLKKDPDAEIKKKQGARKKQKHSVDMTMSGKAAIPTSPVEKVSDSSTMRPANATPSPKEPTPSSSMWANGTPANTELDFALEMFDRRKKERELHNLTKKKQPMDVQTLSPWALKLKAHLEEFSPNLVLELRAENRLNRYVQERADHAAEIVADHIEAGLPFNQAFEFVKDQLYPPPEQPAPQ